MTTTELLRGDLRLVASLVPEGSKVLDPVIRGMRRARAVLALLLEALGQPPGARCQGQEHGSKNDHAAVIEH